MSYPDPQPPLGRQPFMSPSFTGGDDCSFWQPFTVGVEQPPNSIRQFENPQPLKKPKTSEIPISFPPSAAPNSSRMNPLGSKGTSHIFYKTRLCAQFRDGTCRNGENCTFAHGNSDLRYPPPNWQELVKEKDREAGNSSLGDDQRMIHRMKICKKYYNGEECPYGEKCSFVHERPHQSNYHKFDSTDQRESSAISIGVTADQRGPTGNFEQPSFWKTKICSKWEMGICPYGDRCSFAHGHSELRFSSTPFESEQAMNTCAAPRKPTSVTLANSFPAFGSAPGNLAIGSSPAVHEDQERTLLKWKLTRKVNRIYADWIDNLSPPPPRSPAGEDS